MKMKFYLVSLVFVTSLIGCNQNQKEIEKQKELEQKNQVLTTKLQRYRTAMLVQGSDGLCMGIELSRNKAFKDHASQAEKEVCSELTQAIAKVQSAFKDEFSRPVILQKASGSLEQPICIAF